MDIQGYTFVIVTATFALYLGIAIWSRARTTSGFYVAGQGVPAIANGMATGADWMSAASFLSMAGLISFMGYDGAIYLLEHGELLNAFMLGRAGGDSDPVYGLTIGVGAWLGSIMLFNVWILIWPNQKRVLGIVEASADEIGKAKRIAFLASRTNTMLSIPMMMSMVGAHHGFFM